ncbi:hypothetical protein BN961_02159 [Afipia felis]|uniref:Uncharacterized protein n=1 Tax=Afipia felis TaxID=1035 RepID=A0A090MMY3_AFIFE|nr:hypothetical protein BN961_02159 [Afipia felis]
MKLRWLAPRIINWLKHEQGSIQGVPQGSCASRSASQVGDLNSFSGRAAISGLNYARNTCANGLGTNTFAGLDAVNREGHRNGLLKNVYPDNFLNINLAGAFPTNNSAALQNLSHNESSLLNVFNAQQSPNYRSAPTPFRCRLHRSFQAFLSSWRMG